MTYKWQVEKAREATTNELKNWIWSAVTAGNPIPGCLTVDACRVVLVERGEDGRGYHDT